MFFFFFSSRRRHTRCGRDWSSDVCSSDLWDGGGRHPAHCGWCAVTRAGERPINYNLLQDLRNKAHPLLNICDDWQAQVRDRKSTRLNSSHVRISYAVFCLKKKNDIFKHLKGHKNTI